MQKETTGSEISMAKTAPVVVVLTVLSSLKNGNTEEALVCFAEEFQFKDHGLGLEFTDKKRLAEFFEKTRELYPDTSLQADAVFANGNRVVAEWTLQATLTEPLYGQLKRSIRVSLRGASVVRVEHGKIADWADYYDGLTSRRTALGSYFTEWIEL